MPSGAVHPNTTNFSRVPRLNIVERMRKLVNQGAYESRPAWLEFAERAPPMELENLKLRDIKITNPYPAMIKYVLSKYPDMRFQDCFVDGNDWTKGNDRYRDDHPVMQFVARQLQLMNTEGLPKKAAFERTQEEFLARRTILENRQKLNMALAHNQRIVPAFSSPDAVNPLYTTGAGVARQREAQLEVEHLNHIRRKLRMLRKEIEPHDKRRMNAKEMALDMELERTGLLPKLSKSEYKIETSPKEDSNAESSAESVNTIQEAVPSTRPETGRFSRAKPIFLKADESSYDSIKVNRAEHVVDESTGLLNRTISNRRKKHELEKRIGKEPGGNNDDVLDFEDFMSLVRKK